MLILSSQEFIHLILVNLFTKVNSKHLYFARLWKTYSEVKVFMNHFTDRIRGLREDNDLTQSQVAAVLGTSQTMYARYERGANEMPIRHLVTLCKFYNISADYLLDTAPSPHRKQKKAQHFC